MEQRIQQIFQRLQDLFNDRSQKTTIDLDLMLDYTRVLYADLLEMRRNTPALPQQHQNIPAPQNVSAEPSHSIPTPVVESPTQPVGSTDQEAKAQVENLNETVDDLKKEANSAIAFELPHVKNEPKIINEAIEEEAPAPPQPEPVIIPVENNINQNDIRSVIGINDKYLFLNELFSNHKSDYETALDEINNMKNIEEAMAWVKAKSATKSVWDEDGDTVQNFVAVLKKHFSELR